MSAKHRCISLTPELDARLAEEGVNVSGLIEELLRERFKMPKRPDAVATRGRRTGRRARALELVETIILKASAPKPAIAPSGPG